MNIAYLANARIPTEKAHGIQIMKMCEAFSISGGTVTLVHPNRHDQIDADPYAYHGVRENFSIGRLPSLDLVRYGKLGYRIQLVSFLVRLAGKRFPRGTIFYTRDVLLALSLAFMNKKVMFEVHMGTHSVPMRLLIARGIPMVAITQGLKDFLVSKGQRPERVLVAHDGADLHEFSMLGSRIEERSSLGLPTTGRLVGYIGKYRTLGKSKGLEGIVEAFSVLKKTHPDSHLLIVGILESEEAEVRLLCRSHDLDGASYTIVPHVERRRAIRYMRAADVLVLNYPDDEQFARYTSPLKLFEYMAAGSVIVTSDHPGLREVLDERTALFSKPDDAASLAAALARALDETEHSEELRHAALERVRSYTWEGRARKIMEFMKEAWQKES